MDTDLLAHITEPYIRSINNYLINITKNGKSKFNMNNPETFKKNINKYLSKKFNLLYHRTIINPHHEYLINDLYTEMHLIDSKGNCIYPSYSNIKDFNNFIIISGNGGMGKSILLKRLFYECISNSCMDWKIPIYLELRNIIIKNNDDEYLFENYILQYFEDIDIDIDGNDMKILLEEGRIIFLLDALDEVKSKDKKILNKSIENFSNKYEKNTFILTSRPNFSIYSRANYKILRLNPLNNEQCKELITKNCKDEKGQKRFLEYLDSETHNHYSKLVSSPLMLLIMFKTFEYTGEISKVSKRFYEKTFMTMFSTHDNDKDESYMRERKVELSQDEFESIFSYFCAISYIRQQYSFDESSIKQYSKDSIDKWNKKNTDEIKVDSEMFIHDLVYILCLIINDDEEYTFIHRSFQEYYFIKFLQDLNDETQYKFLNKIFDTYDEDSDLEDVLRFYKESSYNRYIYNCIYKPIVELIEEYESYKNQDDRYNFFIDLITDFFEGNIYFNNHFYNYALKELIKLKGVTEENIIFNNYSSIKYIDIKEKNSEKSNFFLQNILPIFMDTLRKWVESYDKYNKTIDFSSKDLFDII